jgi:hypothetical protein
MLVAAGGITYLALAWLVQRETLHRLIALVLRK